MFTQPPRALRFVALFSLLLIAAPLCPAWAASIARSTVGAAAPGQSALSAGIVAVVNGDVISRADVDNRRRLFALSTGLPPTPEVLDRLTPQVTRLLIDERLRLQEVQRRKIIVSDKDIADAIAQIERQNRMAPGALRAMLQSDGVAMRTLIDQVRVQLGWGRVLREQLGENAGITPADIAEREREIAAQAGKEEYRVSEIFIPVDTPSHEPEARRFADAVIERLRNGAPFAVVAAQFSQSQTALQGGDIGWVEPPNGVDPEVARIVTEMPVGAVSNPIRVAGGYEIVTLRAKRQVGNDPATMLKVGRVLFPFTSALDPRHPTEQQRKQLERAKRVAASAHSCEEMKAQAGPDAQSADITEVRLETVPVPQLRAILAELTDGKPSKPLVTTDGIGLLMVCSRETKNLGSQDREQIATQLLNERIELASRQMMRDLQRRAVIERRGAA